MVSSLHFLRHLLSYIGRSLYLCLPRLICRYRKHTPEKVVLVKNQYIYAFQCKRCGKPMGIPIVRKACKPNQNPNVHLRVERIIYSDRVRHLHKRFDKAKAI